MCRAPDLAEGPLYAVVTPDPDHGSFDADVVDATGNVYVHLSGYRTVALFNSRDAEPLKALQAVVSREPSGVNERTRALMIC